MDKSQIISHLYEVTKGCQPTDVLPVSASLLIDIYAILTNGKEENNVN